MHRACHLLLIGMVLVFPNAQLRAGLTVSIESENIRCTIPDGWHQIPLKGAVLAAVPDTPDGRAFTIMVQASPFAPTPQDASGYSDFEKGFWGKYDSLLETFSHSRIDHRGFTTMGGVPYRVLDLVRKDPIDRYKTVQTRVMVTTGDGKVFNLISINHGIRQDEDIELNEAAQSFAFINPPSPPLDQPLLKHINEVIGLPVLLGGICVIIYLLASRRNPGTPTGRMLLLAVISSGLLSLNCVFIAGVNSLVGLALCCSPPAYFIFTIGS